MSAWPKHPDGRPKKMGEMTREEAWEQTKIACKRLEAEFAQPAVKAKLAAILNGDNVNQ